jgi:hypothetical protein
MGRTRQDLATDITDETDKAQDLATDIADGTDKTGRGRGTITLSRRRA